MSSKDKTYDDVLEDPAGAYRAPEDVLADDRFGPEAKHEILKSWERDARELAVAEQENMAGGEPNMLGRVLDALRKLEGDTPADERAKPEVPTMHGSSDGD